MKPFEILRAKIAKALPGSGNTIALGMFEMSNTESVIPVERDASGVPVAWRIFKLGANEITQKNSSYSLDFTGEVFDLIIAYFAEKGSRIPLDSHHFLYHLADKLGVDESEVLKFLPDGTATFGFCNLEKRTDGLWVTNVEYVPLARDLMAQGIFRYFSPVLRGLVDGRLRITSVTFENEPALNNLDAIAASAERGCGGMSEIQGKLDAIAASANIARNNQTNPAAQRCYAGTKEKKMNKLFIALAGLLGMDSISLGADGDASADVVTKVENLKTEVKGLREVKTKVTGFIGAIRDKLALGADADLNAVEGRIIALSEKAGQADQLKLRVDALELSAENEKREKLIELGKAEGKLSNKMIAGEWLKNMNSVALAAFLKDADVVTPLGQVQASTLSNPDAVALSAEDKTVARLLGLDEAKMLEAKKSK